MASPYPQFPPYGSMNASQYTPAPKQAWDSAPTLGI